MDSGRFTASLSTTSKMKKYPLVFIADKDYLHYSLVNLINLQQQGFENLFIIMDSKETEEKFKLLKKHLQLNCQSLVYDINKLIDENKKKAMDNHVTPFAYVSCKIPEIFPLYEYVMLLPVDCALDRLSEMNISTDFNQPIAAVPDLQSTQILINGIADDTYFNAGVLIFNIKKWNELKLSQEVTNLLKDGKTYIFHDQDILNKVVNGSFHKLPGNLNSIPEALTEDKGELIHFAGSSKPWMPNCNRIGVERWQQNCLTAILKIEGIKNSTRLKIDNESAFKIRNGLKKLIKFFLKESYRIESQTLRSEIEFSLNKLRSLQR